MARQSKGSIRRSMKNVAFHRYQQYRERALNRGYHPTPYRVADFLDWMNWIK